MRLAVERRELILAAVRARGTVRLSELVDELGASPVTVRRDVTALADRGLARWPASATRQTDWCTGSRCGPASWSANPAVPVVRSGSAAGRAC